MVDRLAVPHGISRCQGDCAQGEGAMVEEVAAIHDRPDYGADCLRGQR